MKEVSATECDESESKPDKPVWNSLEWAKISVGVLTPAVILIFGHQLTSSREETSAETAKYVQVVKKRVELWDKSANSLNDVYCYFLYVGPWKSLSPVDIINRKRELDRIVYANRPFFSDRFFRHYQAFMDSAYEPYRGWGKDAALRTRAIRPKDEQLEATSFTGKDNSEEIHQRYFELLKVAASELNIEIPEAGAKVPKTPQSKKDIEPTQP
jgi:hypothetical protein